MNDSPSKFRLADISATTFASQVTENPVILLPLGSHEDHGPHLPMGDYLLAEDFAVRIAQAASARGVKTFMAPCLPFGAADYFGSSPGGLAISAASFRAILRELLAGLLQHGLSRIVILNGHGGNVSIIHEVTLELKRQNNLVIPSFYLWKIARQIMQNKIGQGQEGRFGHGAEPLLSLTKARRSDLVRASTGGVPAAPAAMLGLPVTNFGTADFLGFPVDIPAEFDQVPRDAIADSWPMASTELGVDVADALVDLATKFVVHFARVSSISGASA